MNKYNKFWTDWADYVGVSVEDLLAALKECEKMSESEFYNYLVELKEKQPRMWDFLNEYVNFQV